MFLAINRKITRLEDSNYLLLACSDKSLWKKRYSREFCHKLIAILQAFAESCSSSISRVPYETQET